MTPSSSSAQPTLIEQWNQFWFTPIDPATLGVVRIGIGCMLAYSHLVWAIGSDAFFGSQSWLNASAVTAIGNGSWSTSPLWWLQESPALLGLTHMAAFVTAICLAIGLLTRAAAIVSFCFVLAYAHRNPAALYGFDQVIGFMTLYLAIGPSGSTFSLDEYLTPTRHRVRSSIGANVATRLMQLHLCVLYFFAGVSKLKGVTWWNGFAIWGAIANQEYQTVDLTWLASWPIIINLMTQVSVWWEVSYPALVWNRHTRPVMLALAVAVHLGIGACFGMLTFGCAMLLANFTFIPPHVVRTAVTNLKTVLNASSKRQPHLPPMEVTPLPTT